MFTFIRSTKQFTRSYKLYKDALIKINPTDDVNMLIKKLNPHTVKSMIDALCNKQIKTSPLLVNKIVNFIIDNKQTYKDYSYYYKNHIDNLFEHVSTNPSLADFNTTQNYVKLDIMATNKQVYNINDIDSIINNHNEIMNKLYSIDKQTISTFLNTKTFDRYTHKKVNQYLLENNITLDKDSFKQLVESHPDIFCNITTLPELVNRLSEHIAKDKPEFVHNAVLDTCSYLLLEYKFSNNNEFIKHLVLSIGGHAQYRDYFTKNAPLLYDRLKHISGILAVLTTEESISFMQQMQEHHEGYLRNNTTSWY